MINHVANLYGKESVCQIITFGTLASKAAIKDVGRALEMPYAEVERIGKMIPPPVRGRNVHIAQAIEQVPELRAAIAGNAGVADLIDLAQRLEGCARHASVHAAGVVISPRPLDELVPVAVSGHDELVTQYPMADLEKTGMLKMDFLALTALTVISDCLITIKKLLNKEIEWSAIALDDAAAMQLFADGRTEAIFQFESTGMQEICRRLKPKSIEDLAALNALYRPGPLDGGMVDDYIERHHGHKSVRYLVPEMKELLSNTHGIIVYQEQIMQLAQKLAGYSLGEADLMRRAMGKKKREEMARHEEKFVDGAVLGGIKKEKAQQIFSLMAQFADYGFNRSHSVAYALLAFQTAYLKAHYPEHFYAAVLSNELHDAAKVFRYANELRGQGIKLLPPDVNESWAGFTPLEGAIRYGLAAIKGVGQASVEAILEARAEGSFSSIFDFAERTGQRALNKRVLESLVCAGAFDSLNRHAQSVHAWRAQLFAGIDGALSLGARAQRARACGQSDLFGNVAAAQPEQSMKSLPTVEAWTHGALLAAEKGAVGFYITSHPLRDYSDVLQELGCSEVLRLTECEHGARLSLGGIVTALQVKTTKKGDRFALMRLEDEAGSVKCVVWPEVFNKTDRLLETDAAVLVTGRVDGEEDGGATIIVDEVERLDEVRQRRARTLIVRIPSTVEPKSLLESVFRILDKHRGNCEVVIEMMLEGNMLVRTRAHRALRVQGSLELETTLQNSGCRVEWLNTGDGFFVGTGDVREVV